MELQISDLVSSIKKDGIEAANAEAEKIIAKAKETAAKIVSDAEGEALKIKEKTEAEINVLKESAKVSAEHAERDATLSFKESVKAEFEKLLDRDIGKTVNGETLAILIKAAINGDNPADYTAQTAEVTEALKAELAKEIKEGLTVKPSKNVSVGFRLSANDGSGYFDCSDEEITKMLMPFFPELNI